MTDSIFGRSPEIAVIISALASVKGGTGGVIHIVGEAGIGKTALLAIARGEADKHQLVHRTAAADDGDHRRPLALIAQLLPHLGASSADPVGAALASIDRVAGGRPIVLLVDDVHWADGASLGVLAAIAQRSSETDVVLITTARPHPPSIDLGRFETAVERAGTRLELDGLSVEDISALVQATIGAPPTEHLLRLLADASGNPFLTIELLRALQHDGTLLVDAGALRLAPDVPLPARLRGRLAREAIVAAGNDSLLVRAAAVIPGGFLAEELATILARPITSVLGDLLALSDAKVLTNRNDRLGFRHDIIRQAVIDATPTAVVRALNRRAVEVLTAARADPVRVASCLLVAADPSDHRDLDALIDLGMSLRERHPLAAIDLLTTALSALAETDPRRRDVALALGWAQLDLGRFADVLGLLDEHLGDYSTAAPLDVQLLRGQALTLCGTTRSVVSPLPADFDITSSFPVVDAQAVAAVAELSTLQVLSGHVESAQRLVEWVERRAEEMDSGGMVYLCETKALLHARMGFFEAGLEAALRGLEIAIERPSSAAWRARPTLSAAMMLDAMGRGEEALSVLRGARNDPGPRWNAPLMQFGTAISLYRRGEWDDAQAEIAAGLAANDELGMRLGSAWPFALNIMIHTAQGEHAAARSWMERAQEAVNAGALGVEWMMYAAAMVDEAAGDLDAAARILRDVVDAALSLDAPAVLMNLSPDAARLAVATDDDKTLHRVIDNVDGVTSHTRSPVAHAFADWARGWQLEDHRPVERAATSMAACRRGADAARAHHDAAVLAAGAGCPTEARRLATLAFAGYEHMRAEHLHARLRAELRSAGVSMRPRRGRPRPTSGWEGLTRTERQIVDLVAVGLMNSEIADRLFVSRRTVESHLARVYPKLGFPRRAELAIAARQRRE